MTTPALTALIEAAARLEELFKKYETSQDEMTVIETRGRIWSELCRARSSILPLPALLAEAMETMLNADCSCEMELADEHFEDCHVAECTRVMASITAKLEMK